MALHFAPVPALGTDRFTCSGIHVLLLEGLSLLLHRLFDELGCALAASLHLSHVSLIPALWAVMDLLGCWFFAVAVVENGSIIVFDLILALMSRARVEVGRFDRLINLFEVLGHRLRLGTVFVGFPLLHHGAARINQ